MGLVGRYKQSWDYRWKAGETVEGKLLPTVTSDGACFAVSIHWIVKNANAQDFWAWLGASKSASSAAARDSTDWRDHSARAGDVASEVKSLMAVQKTVTASSNTPDFDKFNLAIRTVEEKTALRAVLDEDNLKMSFLGKNPNTYTKALGTNRGYKYISLGGFLGTGDSFQHGIAAQVGNNVYRVFDPNVGEFKADSAVAFDQDLQDIIVGFYKLRIRDAFFATFA